MSVELRGMLIGKELFMKLIWMITVMMVACLAVSAEVSKDKLKELKSLVQIEGVRDYEEEHQEKKSKNSE